MNGSGEHAWILSIREEHAYTYQLLDFYIKRAMCNQCVVYVKKGGIEKLQVWHYVLNQVGGLVWVEYWQLSREREKQFGHYTQKCQDLGKVLRFML